MLTRCLSCNAWFRVRAEHLSVAGGQVTCGQCNAVFNALETLIEEGTTPPVLTPVTPPPGAAPVPADDSDTTVPNAIVASVPGADAAPAADEDPHGARGWVEDAAMAPADTVATVSGEATTDREPRSEPEPDTDSATAAQIPPAAGDDAPDVSDTVADAVADNAANNAEVPPLLEAELAMLAGHKPALSRAAKLWRVAAVVALVVLVAQLAFVYRQALLAAWPAAAPMVDRVCSVIRCSKPRDEADGIRLLARDVREHPQYLDVLLVNATMVNNGPLVEPYPQLELRLNNAAGELIGARRFEPQEYLDDSIAIPDGMAVAQPVYVVMEIAGEAATAASFEIDFR